MQSLLRFLLVLSLLFVGTGSAPYEPEKLPAFLEQADAVWQRVMLPFRIASLSAKDPDAVLLMPVAGVRVAQVADTWGAPRGGGTRRHQGQDIFAARLTPVHSATDGIVLRVADSGLGGRHVFVLGAGGRRYYYAHLEAFAEELHAGDSITTATVLGYVGSSGNARGTPPHLHFGLYSASGALNPLPLLRNRL